MQFYVLFFSGPIFLYLLDVTLGTREVNNTSRFSDRKNHPLSLNGIPLNLIDIKMITFFKFHTCSRSRLKDKITRHFSEVNA